MILIPGVLGETGTECMVRNSKIQRQRTKRLDRHVRPYAVFLAALLFSVQVFLPLSPVFADEVSPSEGVATESLIEIPSELVVDEPIPEGDSATIPDPTSEAPPLPEESVEEVVVQDDPTLQPELDPVAISEDAVSDQGDIVPIDSSSSEEVSPYDDMLISSTTDALVDDSTSSSTSLQDPNITDEEEVFDEAPISNEIDDPIVVLDEESATEDEQESVPDQGETATATQTVVAQEAHTVQGESYAFAKDQCVRVEDGSYYCRSEDVAVTSQGDDRIYAAPDIDGDMELFIDKAGETKQLTFNAYDDGAPFYDPVSNTIVFHRLIDARYQVMLLDLETNTESQLTRDRYNNMEPSRAGASIVWQGWVGNDWEIFLEHDGSIEMLTDNTVQDIGPVINGEYVIWQTTERDMPMVKMYNIRSGTIESIPGTDGMAVMNPRMVLVYETEDEHGDTFTLGYDLKKKHVESLSAKARPLPERIPDPDQGNEERALITQVTQLKTKTEDDHDGEDGLTDLLTASSSDPFGNTLTDVIVPPFATSTETSTSSDAVSIEVPAPSSIPDLVIGITPIEAVLSSDSIQVIEDLVVPPFVSESTSTDPQP